jgi:hypothetical protein
MTTTATETEVIPFATPQHTGPRTDELPMAFTAWEFIRGALATYGFFLASTAVVWVWATPFASLIALIYVAPFGFASLILVGAPLALLTGIVLRRTTATVAHVLWHGLVGLGAGGAGVLFALSVVGPNSMWEFTSPHVPDLAMLASVWIIAVVEALLTVGSAMLGWRYTSRKALRTVSG